MAPLSSSRAGVALLLGLGLIAGGCDRQATNAAQADLNATAPAPVATSPAPVNAGKVDRSHAGEAPPPAQFVTPDGSDTRLSDFVGKPLLVNLWATWCAPCVAELPTLDRLAGEGGIRVLAVSQDLEDRNKVAAFLTERRVTRLQPYHDPKLGLSVAYGANLPLTILYGADGREVWRVAGAMDWTGAEGRKLLSEV